MITYRRLLASYLLIALNASTLQGQDRSAARLGVTAPTHFDARSATAPKLAYSPTPDTLGAFMVVGALVGAVVMTTVAIRGAETHDPIVFPLGCMLAFIVGAGAGAGVGFVLGEAVRFVGR